MKCNEIVLTGSPCSGKTTGLAYVVEKLRDWGFRVFVKPEIATMFFSSGIPDIGAIKQKDLRKYIEIEKQILLTEMDFRKRLHDLAAVFQDEKKVIVSDRGCMDVMAYLPPGYFEAILKETGLTLFAVRDSYDVVVHLVTAAIGAEAFYTITNNKARSETLEEARALDTKTIEAWVGSPHFKAIDNSTDFAGKMKRTLQAITRGLGIPVPIEIERWFLLSEIPDLSACGVPVQEVVIEQMYLVSEDLGEEVRIRKRTQGDYSSYYRTHKKRISPGVANETEQAISAVDYLDLQRLRDSARRVIKKRRFCFMYNYQYFELDVFLDPPGLCKLEIELTEENESIMLPPFLKVKKEVTGDPQYSNFGIALL